jgi:hypothetical protein
MEPKSAVSTADLSALRSVALREPHWAARWAPQRERMTAVPKATRKERHWAYLMVAHSELSSVVRKEQPLGSQLAAQLENYLGATTESMLVEKRDALRVVKRG